MSLIGALKAAKKTAPFYSAVDEALGNLKRPKGTGIEFLTEVLKQPGVKKAEIADRKLEQAFKAKGKMTKEEAQQVLADNPPPQLRQKVYDESTAIDEADLREMVSQEMFGKPYNDIRFGSDQHRQIDVEVYSRMDADNGTKFGKYRTPDGENYREILLKLPKSRPNASNYSDPAKYDADLRAYNTSGKSDYYNMHFPDDANIVAHMRVQDRKGPNGEKILHVEEIQSDWHQEGRKKGYRTKESLENWYNQNKLEGDPAFADLNGEQINVLERNRTAGMGGDNSVPDAPFKKNWHELAMKRLLNYAADNGYDSIAITPGAEQAKRYDLSKQINTISWNKQTNGMYGIEADTVDGRPIIKKGLTEKELEDTVGKEVASRIVNGVGQFENDPLFGSGFLTSGRLDNLDLQVGGEGMKGFYDKILPDYLNTFGKPYGAQVGQIPLTMKIDPKLAASDDALLSQLGVETPKVAPTMLHNFPITPEMRESIKQKGLPLYQQVGIPTAGAGAASQALQPEEELGLAGGGSVAKLAALAKLKKMREEMTPRAEAVKSLIARDENSYLRDVAPNSLTNPEIEAEIQRMAARAEASKPEVKEAKGGRVRMTKNRDAMFMELSNKKLKRK